MILVFDGPEKAGKTTLIASVRAALIARGINVVIRKWGPIFPDDRVYAPAIRGDVNNPDTVTIWDRSWAAEAVCGKLLHRDRRLAHDWFLGEWLHGRPVMTVGQRFMVLPNSWRNLVPLRDSTDIDVDPRLEYSAYNDYARQYLWPRLINNYDYHSLESNTNYVVGWVNRLTRSTSTVVPPDYVGPPGASRVIVGISLSDNPGLPGAWVPFSSRLTSNLGRALGPRSLRYGWTNADTISTEMFERCQVAVTCGLANNWVEIPATVSTVINIYHPSFTFRFKVPSPVWTLRGDPQVAREMFGNLPTDYQVLYKLED